MTQQHAQFEEEFRHGPQPHETSYQDGYAEKPPALYATPGPPQSGRDIPSQPASVSLQGYLPSVPVQQSRSTSAGARVTLAIFSLIFVLIMFIVALVATASETGSTSGLGVLAMVLALVFAFIAFLINLVVNLVSLRR